MQKGLLTIFNRNPGTLNSHCFLPIVQLSTKECQRRETKNTKEWHVYLSPVVVISPALKLFSPSEGESRWREGFGQPKNFGEVPLPPMVAKRAS